jgi:hypothetical protein
MTTARSYTDVDARIYGGEMAYGVTITPALSLSEGGSYSRGTVTPRMEINVMSHNLTVEAGRNASQDLVLYIAR